MARANAALMMNSAFGKNSITLIGGAPLVTGQHTFELFNIDPENGLWSKLPLENSIVHTLGSKPVYIVDKSNQKYKIFLFSGMVPLQRINSGVRVCPPDMLYYDSSTQVWTREQMKKDSMIDGRKNYAISELGGKLWICGGMSQGQNVFSDIL